MWPAVDWSRYTAGPITEQRVTARSYEFNADKIRSVTEICAPPIR